MKLIWDIALPSELNRDRQILVNERRIWASLGPMDVPREVIITRQHKRVQMELHYSAIRDEKLLTVENGTLRISTGKQSGRVYFVECEDEIDIEALCQPLQQLHSAARGIDQSLRPQRLSAHYQLIAEDVLPFVIDQIKHEIMLESR